MCHFQHFFCVKQKHDTETSEKAMFQSESVFPKWWHLTKKYTSQKSVGVLNVLKGNAHTDLRSLKKYGFGERTIIAYLSNNLSGQFTCSYCKSKYVNLVQHCIHECRYLDAERIMMVTNIQLFDAAVYFFICRLDKTSKTLFLLGENNVQISEYLGAEFSRFYDLCAVSLHRMWSKIYNRLK